MNYSWCSSFAINWMISSTCCVSERFTWLFVVVWMGTWAISDMSIVACVSGFSMSTSRFTTLLIASSICLLTSDLVLFAFSTQIGAMAHFNLVLLTVLDRPLTSGFILYSFVTSSSDLDSKMAMIVLTPSNLSFWNFLKHRLSVYRFWDKLDREGWILCLSSSGHGRTSDVECYPGAQKPQTRKFFSWLSLFLAWTLQARVRLEIVLRKNQIDRKSWYLP